MLNVKEKIASRFGFERKLSAAAASPRRTNTPVISARRSLDAGQLTRLTASWTTSSNSINQDVYRNLRVLRARSRDLSYNNDYAKKFLQMGSTHVVGPNGFKLQVRSKNATGALDQAANTSIEAAFADWSRRGVCDVSGKLSLCDIKHSAIKATMRDGEALIRKIYGGKINAYGFALQVLDIDRLDIEYNEELRGGNIIKMGIEITPYGKPVAYYLFTKHPGDSNYWSAQGSHYERVPAEDIYHLFMPERPEQTRGLPWMHSAMKRLNNIGGYEEAAIIAARIGASKMGFFQSPEGDGTALADDQTPDGELLTEADPGQFGMLPQGYSFESFDPDYPHAMYGDFIKAALRGVASGLGVAYNTLSNDLENVNFSSIRSGTLEERDNWMVIQKWFIESFLDDLYSTWLKFSLLNAAITLPEGSVLPLTRFDKYNVASWRGRRWSWVDPKSDVDAAVTAVNNRFKSRTGVIADMGFDVVDSWEEIKQEEAMAKTMKIELPPISNLNNNVPKNGGAE